MLGCTFENVGDFDHLHHEGGPSALQVITGAHSGENTVHKSNLCLFGWNKATCLSQNGDQGDRTKIGRFPAHVWAGDQQETPFLIHHHIIGDKSTLSLKHGMAGIFEFDGVLLGHLRFRPCTFPTD